MGFIKTWLHKKTAPTPPADVEAAEEVVIKAIEQRESGAAKAAKEEMSEAGRRMEIFFAQLADPNNNGKTVRDIHAAALKQAKSGKSDD